MGKWGEKRIIDCMDFVRPDNFIENDINTNHGSIPVLTANKSFILGYSDNPKGTCNNVPAIIFDDFTTDKKYVDFPFKVRSSAIKILYSKCNYNLKYLYELMQDLHFNVAEHKRHYISEYQILKIKLPENIKEQEKIAEILSTVDTAIEKTKAIIEKYKNIKDGMLQDLLTNGIDEKGNIRSKSTHEYKPSPLGDIPVEWDCVEFGCIANVCQGLQISIDKRFTDNYLNDYYQYITVDFLNSKKSEYYVSRQANSVHCTKEDVLMTRTGNTGTVITDIEGVFHNNFFKIIYNVEKITKDYLFYYLNRGYIKEYFKNVSGTTTIPDLKHKDFLKTNIKLPREKSEQEEITKRLDAIDKNIISEQKYLAKLESTKKGLMQDLLNNRISVDCLL